MFGGSGIDEKTLCALSDGKCRRRRPRWRRNGAPVCSWSILCSLQRFNCAWHLRFVYISVLSLYSSVHCCKPSGDIPWIQSAISAQPESSGFFGGPFRRAQGEPSTIGRVLRSGRYDVCDCERAAWLAEGAGSEIEAHMSARPTRRRCARHVRRTRCRRRRFRIDTLIPSHPIPSRPIHPKVIYSRAKMAATFCSPEELAALSTALKSPKLAQSLCARLAPVGAYNGEGLVNTHACVQPPRQ